MRKESLGGRAPSGSERDTVAASLAAATLEGRLLIDISGAKGAGKSVLLNDLEAQYRAGGVQVHRDHNALDLDTFTARSVVLIDDAHLLSESDLTRVHSLVDEREVNLVVAYRPWPRSAALKQLIAAFRKHNSPIVLGPLTHREITAYTAAVLDGEVPPELVEEVTDLTGGMPWLVERLMAGIQDDDRRTVTQPLVSRRILAQIGEELDGVNGVPRELLLALSAGFTSLGQIPPVVNHEHESIDNIIARGKAAGLLLPDGRLIPLVRKALLETTPVHRVRALQQSLVETLTAEGRLDNDSARTLAQDGFKDPRIVDVLERAGDNALAAEPHFAVELYEEARTAGSNDLSTAARRAQAASAIGDLDSAGRILDDLLAHKTIPDLARGVDVAASVWAQRGMLAHSAEVYQWLGLTRIGSSAPLAAVAMIGTGDKEGAKSMLMASAPDGSPTLLTVAVTLMGQGIRDSVDGQPQQALSALVRASDTMTASGAYVPLPDVPAALTALVALHSGETNVAKSVIDAALKGTQGGAAARPRLLLLRAWAAMQEGKLDQARAAVDEITEISPKGLVPRDEFFLYALEVGLARRAGNTPIFVEAWRRARESISRVSVDLYSLIPLGELCVAAARLRESSWLEPHLTEAWALLARLGNPPLWSTPLHWCAVQAALLNERPKDLAPHAAALVHASGHSDLASVLAVAGRAWVSVFASDFEVSTVEAAARGLASVGLPWDGSRLAGHAAARAEERRDMTQLLACARDLYPGASALESVATGSPQSSLTIARVQNGATTNGSSLSAREYEVAGLVLEGRTYREIGETIFISTRTVEHHMARIRRRLGAKTRSELLTQLRLLLGEVETRRE